MKLINKKKGIKSIGKDKQHYLKNSIRKSELNIINKPLIDNQIICASRNSTIHLIDIINENYSFYDIIFENEYSLEIFKAKLSYIRYFNKLNFICKKEYIKRRYKNNNIVLMHINDPLNFMERIEDIEKKKEMFKLNKQIKLNNNDSKNVLEKNLRKYLIYTKQINAQLLNAEFKIKYLNKSINFYEEFKFININFEKEVSFYDKLEININNNKINAKINNKINVINKLEEENNCKENDILDKRIPIYLFNPTLNMYFPLLLEILNKLKTYKMRILIITTNPNKLVELLNKNKIKSKQYQTTTYNLKYEREDNKDIENIIYISNIRYTFEKFDIVIEFLINDLTKITETINKKLNIKKFSNGNENQKDILIDFNKIGNLKLKNINEMIFEKGVIIFPIFTEFNKKYSTFWFKNNIKILGDEFDIKNFIKN